MESVPNELKLDNLLEFFLHVDLNDTSWVEFKHEIQHVSTRVNILYKHSIHQQTH